MPQLAPARKGHICEQVLYLLQEMRCSCLEPDLINYNASISACSKGQSCGQALSLMQQMRLSILQLNVISYSATISACFQGQLFLLRWRSFLEVHTPIL